MAALVCKFGGSIEVITIYFHIYRVVTHTSETGCRALVLNNLRIARHLLTQNLCNFPYGLVTLPFLRQTNRHLCLIVHRGGEHGGDSSLIVRTG